MTLQLSPAQNRIRCLSEVLLSELHEYGAGPLQDCLADQLNQVLLDLEGATVTATLVA
jgi:hypothetical protein